MNTGDTARNQECFVYLEMPHSLEVVTCGRFVQEALPGGEVIGRFVYDPRYRVRADAIPLDPVHLPISERARRSFWVNLGLFLYCEAAALLRLRDLPFVPRLRAVDVADNALYVDCLQGENLRTLAAATGQPVYDRDLIGGGELARLSTRELERREVALLESSIGGGFRREIAAMVQGVRACGVVPMDIKLGNFIRGARTGQLYWIDFESSRLASQPGWELELDLSVQRSLLEEIFEFSRYGQQV